jgi:hypothetical protein
MEVTINQTVKRYDVVVNQTTKQINVNIVNQQKQTSVIISPLGKRGFKGEPGVYTDIELAVTQDDQTQFNIFSEPIQSNLFINDSIYFKDKSYQIQNISGNWKLIWLDEFQLKTTDLLIFRKI